MQLVLEVLTVYVCVLNVVLKYTAAFGRALALNLVQIVEFFYEIF